MGRKSPVPTAEKGLKKGAWSAEEDEKLIAYIRRYGIWNWNHMAKPAGLLRSGKSCRLRWLNYLRPNIRHGNFSREEIEVIIRWHKLLGNRWSTIAEKLHGRTDNEIKNYWNSRLKKCIIITDESNQSPSIISRPSAPQAISNEIDVPNEPDTAGHGSCSSMDCSISSCGDNDGTTSSEWDGISRIGSPQDFWDELHLPTLVDISLNMEDEFTMSIMSG